MRDYIFITTGRMLVIIGQLLYIKLFTTHLTSSQLGKYFFLVTVSYSLNAIFFVPIDFYQQSKLYQYVRNGTSLKTFFAFNRSLLLLLSIPVILGCAVAKPQIRTYIATTFAMSVMLYLTTTLRNLLNNLEHRRVVALMLALESVFKISFFYMSLKITSPSEITLLGSNIAALSLVLLCLVASTRYLHVFQGGSLQDVRTIDVVTFSYPVSASAVFNWIQLQGYRLVLVPLGFSEVVGLYSTVASIGSNAMVSSSSIFSQLFLPNLYKSAGAYTKRYLRDALFLSIFVLSLAYVFGNQIVRILTKIEYIQYSILLVFGIVAEAGNFLIGAMVVHLTIRNRTKPMMIASFTGMLVMAVSLVIVIKINVNPYTVGLPIVLSQLVVVMFLLAIYDKAEIGEVSASKVMPSPMTVEVGSD